MVCVQEQGREGAKESQSVRDQEERGKEQEKVLLEAFLESLDLCETL